MGKGSLWLAEIRLTSTNRAYVSDFVPVKDVKKLLIPSLTSTAV